MSIERKQAITALVEEYNNLNPENNLIIQEANEVKDISELFVCLYNNNQVGLFTKKTLTTVYKPLLTDSNNPTDIVINVEVIYSDSLSNLIGIKTLRENNMIVNKWRSTGYIASSTKKIYLATCDIDEEMTFESMRLLMYEAGELDINYELGKANQEQILQVLSFAKRYYSSNHQRKKVLN